MPAAKGATFAACVLAWAAPSALAADYWEAQADNVAVIASGGAERAADLASDFVRLQQAFAQLVAPHKPPVKPLIVFAITENDARRYVLSAKDVGEGFRSDAVYPRRSDPRDVSRYFTLEGGDVVAFSGHKGYASPQRRAMALHAAALARTSFPAKYPKWYVLGVDGLFGDVHVESGTVRIEHDVTAMITPKVRTTIDRPLNLATMLDIEPEVDRYPEAWITFQNYGRAMMYYALIERPERRAAIEALAQAVSAGQTREQLAQSLRDPSFEELDQEIERTWRDRSWKTLRLTTAGPASVVAPKRMSEETSNARLAQLKGVADQFAAIEAAARGKAN